MLLNPVVRYLGTISYGIYLLHALVVSVFAIPRLRPAIADWQTPLGGVAYFGVVVVATIALASASWFLFERPINQLKRYFPYPGTPGAARR